MRARCPRFAFGQPRSAPVGVAIDSHHDGCPPDAAVAIPALRSPGIRIFLLAALAFLLMIPLLQVRGLIHEHASRSREALAGIAAPWGQAQQLARACVTGEVPTSVLVGDKTLLHSQTHVLLADNLDIDARLQTETRHRGMFSVPVYTATLQIKATQIHSRTHDPFQLAVDTSLKAIVEYGIHRYRHGQAKRATPMGVGE